MKSSKGETVVFVKRFTGVVEGVIGKGTSDEKYDVRTQDGRSLIIYPKDIIESAITLRKSKTTKPKMKNSCGCK